MKNRIKLFIQSDFATSSFYSAIATIIKLSTLLLMSKIVAVFLGKEGLGLIGQLTNFVTISLVIAGGCINVGVIKYVSEYSATDKQKLTVFLRTGLITLLILSVVSGLSLVIFSGFWSQIILRNNTYADVFVIFGITIILYGLNTYFISVINGFLLGCALVLSLKSESSSSLSFYLKRMFVSIVLSDSVLLFFFSFSL